MFVEQPNYRAYLKNALAEKFASNPAYSMGVLASRAGVSRSFLSEVLSGRKNLSTEAGLKIARQIGLDSTETDYFCLLIQLETAKDTEFRKLLLEKIQALRPATQIHDLSLDLFRTISEWYHLPILELTKLKGFRFTPVKVARKLGIGIAEAEAAIDRLLRLELLETDPGKARYHKTKTRLLFQAKIPNGAVKKFHRQILERAIESLDRQDPAERKGRSDVFPLDPALLQEAEAILDRASEQIIELSGKSKNNTAVYALGVQLFNLTRKGRST